MKVDLDLLAKTAAAEGGYQDIIVGGQKIFEGWRDCRKRWQLMEPYIRDHQTIIDIGSHYGYFAGQIAATHPSTLVWSIEPEYQRAEIQKQMLRANGYPNVVLSKIALSLLDLLQLKSTCEHFNTIICLSTIHYFPPTEIAEIIRAFSNLAPTLIIEFPNRREVDVAERGTVESIDPLHLLEMAYDTVEKIGEVSSPKHPEIMRPMYLAERYNIDRDHCNSYLYNVVGNRHQLKYRAKNGWRLDGKRLKYNGINFANLREFNLAYPTAKAMANEGAERYYSLIQDNEGGVTDIHPRNLIVSNNGVFPIDYSEGTHTDIYSQSWQGYTERVKALSKKQLAEWLLKSWQYKNTRALFNEAGE